MTVTIPRPGILRATSRCMHAMTRRTARTSAADALRKLHFNDGVLGVLLALRS